MPLFVATLGVAIPWLNPFAPGPSPPVVQWVVTLLCMAALLALLGLGLISRRDLGRACAQGWLLAALLSSLMGLVQYYGFSGALAPWVNVTGLGEAFANLRQRNQFATLTSMGLAALLWWQVQAAGESESGPGVARDTRPFYWCCMAALLALGNASSSSRTGMVQLALLALLVAVWWKGSPAASQQVAARWVWRLLLLAFLVYGLALLALPRLLAGTPVSLDMLTRLTVGDSACGGRATLWGNVLYLIAQKPWSGWGWGELGYAHYVTLYPRVRFCDLLDNAHNLPLHVAVELGIPAALLLCGALLWLALRGKPWRQTDPAKRVAWAVLALILLHSLLEYPLWYGPFLMASLLAWPQPKGPSQVGRGPRISILASGAACLLLGFALYTAWDYHRISQIFTPAAERSPAYQDDTLQKIQGSWLFRNQVRYAELTTTPVTRANAPEIHKLALEMLHFSPEARVIEKVIESAVQLSLEDEALFHAQRYRAAFPEDYARWVKAAAKGGDSEAAEEQ